VSAQVYNDEADVEKLAAAVAARVCRGGAVGQQSR
jgi:selenocysteine lyase/cysteine desulfurase